jgi:hypothetical protein
MGLGFFHLMATIFHLSDEDEPFDTSSLADKQSRVQDAEQIRQDFVRSKKYPVKISKPASSEAGQDKPPEK